MELITDFYELFLAKFWRGDPSVTAAPWKCLLVGLAAIAGFCIMWFPVQMLLVILDFLGGDGVQGQSMLIHAAHILWLGALSILIFGCCVTIPMGIWHGILTRMGPDRSQSVAKLGATMCAIGALCLLVATGGCALAVSRFSGGDMYDVHDHHRTQLNASATLNRDPSFPLTGYWQAQCAGMDGGFAIERESRWFNLYRIEDCNNYGCRRSMSSTNIYRDQNFHVVDLNTIEFYVGGGGMTVHRCG